MKTPTKTEIARAAARYARTIFGQYEKLNNQDDMDGYTALEGDFKAGAIWAIKKMEAAQS